MYAGRNVLDALERLLREAGPVLHASGEVTAVDVVEAAGIVPVIFNVVDLEANVGRHACKGYQH
jgi:hypothetical protein